MAGGAGGDGKAGGDHRFHLGRAFRAAVVPVELQPEGVLDLGCPRAGEAHVAAHPGPGIGGQPVDVVPGQAGVGDGGQAGVDGQVDLGATEPPADVGLADAGDGGLALGRGGAHRLPPVGAVGRNSGR